MSGASGLCLGSTLTIIFIFTVVPPVVGSGPASVSGVGASPVTRVLVPVTLVPGCEGSHFWLRLVLLSESWLILVQTHGGDGDLF